MLDTLFTEYTQFVTDGFATFLPFLILFISITLGFSIANQLVYFIRKTVRVK